MLAACSLAGYADEGMWMLTDLKKQNAAVMQDLGLDISIDKVYCPDSISLKDAVVHFGGGCTGEVISAEGLVLTNIITADISIFSSTVLWSTII